MDVIVQLRKKLGLHSLGKQIISCCPHTISKGKAELMNENLVIQKLMRKQVIGTHL